MSKADAPNFRGVRQEPVGPAPTAGPYVNTRFARAGAVTNGAMGPGHRNTNDHRAVMDIPRLRRGR